MPLSQPPCDPAALPRHALLAVFASLPLAQLLRCRGVSRAWRAALGDAGCWTVLHNEPAFAMRSPAALRALLRAACALAGGELHLHGATGAVLAALTGDAALHTLHVVGAALGLVGADGSASDALGALVAADSETLHTLHVTGLALGPLLKALPRNTHLQTLSLVGGFDGGLLPAVRANASLRQLLVPAQPADMELEEAMRTVAQRCEAHLAPCELFAVPLVVESDTPRRVARAAHACLSAALQAALQSAASC
jgi:hypothetical protein